MKKKIKYINGTALYCNNCQSVVISWYRHDYRVCLCKRCSIDGGFDYIRIGGDDSTFKLFNIKVPEELFLLCGNALPKVKSKRRNNGCI